MAGKQWQGQRQEDVNKNDLRTRTGQHKRDRTGQESAGENRAGHDMAEQVTVTVRMAVPVTVRQRVIVTVADRLSVKRIDSDSGLQ